MFPICVALFSSVCMCILSYSPMPGNSFILPIVFIYLVHFDYYDHM